MPKNKAIVVTGIRQIDRRLKKLEAKVQRKVVRQAMAKGLRPVLDAAKANVPVDTGELKKNLKIRAGKGRRGVIRREIRAGSKQMPDWYGQFVEFGVKDRPAQPFLAPAYEAEGHKARDIAIDERFKGCKAEINKGKPKS